MKYKKLEMGCFFDTVAKRTAPTEKWWRIKMWKKEFIQDHLNVDWNEDLRETIKSFIEQKLR